MSQRFSRFLAMAVLVLSAGGLLALPLDAEARRAGGGKSFGMQSSNINKRPAATPPSANTTRNATAPAAGAAAGTAAASRSGMSRFLGPIAGIAAGLGIAALLSHLGLGGALLEFLSSAILIGLVVFAIMFLVRRLRAGGRQPAMAHGGNQGRGGNNSFRESQPNQGGTFQRRPAAPVEPQGQAQAQPQAQMTPAAAPVPAAPVDTSWFIPENFDTANFLANAKQQFIQIQALWDRGNIEELREYMTDDLVAEIKPELLGRGEDNFTEVVLLNAELLGIEQVSGGHLASVRYSGMLRESRDGEAFRFEEIWNLYKGENAGWLLAGIQQIPIEYAR